MPLLQPHMGLTQTRRRPHDIPPDKRRSVCGELQSGSHAIRPEQPRRPACTAPCVNVTSGRDPYFWPHGRQNAAMSRAVVGQRSSRVKPVVFRPRCGRRAPPREHGDRARRNGRVGLILAALRRVSPSDPRSGSVRPCSQTSRDGCVSRSVATWNLVATSVGRA